jgi:Na+-driven multidrug efflux pump
MVLGLRAMAALYIASFTITVLQIGFRTLENTRVVFGAYIVNTVVAVLAAHPIVERFGYEGAVWGMAAQQGLMAALLLIAWRRSGITSARSSSA